MTEEKLIQRDRLRFIKNSLSANLCYLGILFDVFYFVLLYQSDVGTYYYNIQIGASIVYNLLFMLIVFLSSESVKSYVKNYSYVLCVAGVMQIVRIFNIPMAAHSASIVVDGANVPVMDDTKFMLCVVFLAISAVCLIVAAVVNLNKCNALEAHSKYLAEQKG